MSVQITTAFVTQFSTNIMFLLQQQGSRLRSTVKEYAFMGQSATVVEQFGAVTPVKNQARHSNTPLISTPEDRRWCFPNDYDWADLIDQQDKLRLLIDPTGPYTQAGVMAMGRGQDDEILNGFYTANYNGQAGTNSLGTITAYNSGSQVVAVGTGSSTYTGLNVAKLRAAKKLLMAADIDLDNDEIYCVITATQHDNLLNEVQVVDLDYTDRPVLVNGKVSAFMGMNFVHSERIAGATNYAGGSVNLAATGVGTGNVNYAVPVYTKSGMALGIWNDIQASVDKRPDKRNSWQVYVTETIGATRLEEKRCVQINCN